MYRLLHQTHNLLFYLTVSLCCLILAWSRDAVAAAAGVGDTVKRQQHSDSRSSGDSDQLIDYTAEDREFILLGLSFNQTRVLDELQLLAFYEDHLGMRVNLGIIRTVCRDIIAHYRELGYRHATCSIPEQSVSEGVVRISITESAISRVRIIGEPPPRGSILYDYLRHITPNRALDETELVHTSRLINALPGVYSSVDVQPVEGGTDFEVVYEVERTAYDLEAVIDNRGTDPVGKNQASLSLFSYGLLGSDEMLNLYGLVAEDSDELDYAHIDSLWPVGSDGDAITLFLSRSESIPGDIFAASNIEAMLQQAAIGWLQPLHHGNDHRLALNTRVQMQNSTVDDASARLSDDEIYTVTLELDYRNFGRSRFSQVVLALSHALDSRNESTATDGTALVPTGREAFDLLKLDIIHRRALTRELEWSFEMVSQYAFDPLPITATIAYGGADTATAYDPAEFIGDHGLAARNRLDYRIGHSGGLSSTFYGIYDLARVWNQDDNFRESGASAGLGYLLRSRHLALDLQLTQALTRDIALEGNDDMRLFAELGLAY